MRGSVLLGSFFFLASYQQATACTHSAPHSAVRHFYSPYSKCEENFEPNRATIGQTGQNLANWGKMVINRAKGMQTWQFASILGVV